MIVYPPSVLQLYDEGKIKTMGMIRFELGTGTYGFCKSDQPFVYNGLTYHVGGVIEVSDFNFGTNLFAQGFTISLASSPDDGLTPEVLLQIESEDYRDRPVYIMDADFHPDTGELLHVQTVMRGYIDTLDHVSGTDGHMIIANCENRGIDYTRSNARKRNDNDQARRKPNDLIFQHTANRGRQEIFWGRERNSSESVVVTSLNMQKRL